VRNPFLSGEDAAPADTEDRAHPLDWGGAVWPEHCKPAPQLRQLVMKINRCLTRLLASRSCRRDGSYSPCPGPLAISR
jgi:hypothetical protein